MHEPIPVTRSLLPSFDEYIAEVKPLWESRWLTNEGALYRRLENELRGYLNASRISLFTNGHLALEAALEALEVTGEIITTPFTFASTTQAIVRKGLTPVFCDVSPDNFTMDAEKIEELITDKTSAIMPVHVYGNLCDVDKIEEIAEKHNLKVIYDAAHAFGVKKGETSVGNFGDLSIFSFHATKVFHTIEGGGIVGQDDMVFHRLSALKNFGQYSPEDVGEIGGNSKMSEFQAAMGLCNLRHVGEAIQRRKQVVEYYRKHLSSIEGIYVCPEQKGVKSNYAYFPILISADEFGENRDQLYGRLCEKNIFARKYFYPLTSTFRCFRDKFPVQPTPVAQQISEQVLTLPLYADMSVEDAEYVCAEITGGRK